MSVNQAKVVVLKDLTTPGARDLTKSLDRLGQFLAPSKLRGTLQVRLVDDTLGNETSRARLTLDSGKATTSSDAIDNPDVELITSPDTWWEIASGKLAPRDAFFGGRMRVSGDMLIAQIMLKQAAASP